MPAIRKSLFAVAAMCAAYPLLGGPSEAAVCSPAQNDITMEIYSPGSRGRVKIKYCKLVNQDITVSRLSELFDDESIKTATVATKGETGTCDLYMITRQGDRHKKFNIGDHEREKAGPFAKGVYFGFRLGC